MVRSINMSQLLQTSYLNIGYSIIIFIYGLQFLINTYHITIIPFSIAGPKISLDFSFHMLTNSNCFQVSGNYCHIPPWVNYCLANAYFNYIYIYIYLYVCVCVCVCSYVSFRGCKMGRWFFGCPAYQYFN